MITTELWKDIPGYENLYQASNFGDIRTHPYKITHTERHGDRHWKQRIMKFKGYTPKTGYRVSLWKDGKYKDWLVARLIAITFIRLPVDGETVNHINGNRMNNYVGNLEWLSLADNIRHAFRTGLMPQIPVYLIEKSTYKLIAFRSEARASRFLNHNNGYMSQAILKGKTDFGNYILTQIPEVFKTA